MDCYQCRQFAGRLNDMSRCRGYEVENGFVVVRSYARPVPTEDKPCPAWKGKADKARVVKGATKPYDWHGHMNFKEDDDLWT